MSQTSDYLEDGFRALISELRKQSPKKCQDCECLEANYRDGDKGAGWYMDCCTKPDCYQDETASVVSKETKEGQ